MDELFPPLPMDVSAEAPVPGGVRSDVAPPSAPATAAAPAPRTTPLAGAPAAPIFRPTPPKPGASPQLQPEDFDKTVILTGGFEAQPPEEESPPFDDLFPPLKF
jgi:hypothetical protein